MPLFSIPAAIFGAGVLGAGAQIFGAQTGADAQRQAAAQATQAQLQMFQTTQQQLAPFRDVGTTAGNMLTAALPTITTPFGAPAGSGPTGKVGDLNAALAATPGYQFALDQGLKATQSGFASKGLGSSGTALRGAADYAEGLAGTTFQQQFQNYLNQNQQIGSLLTAPTQIGANAAAGIGSAATSTGQSIGGNILGAGQATAGANVASGNAIANAAQGGLNSFLQYNLLSQLTGKNALTNPVANPVASG